MIKKDAAKEKLLESYKRSWYKSQMGSDEEKFYLQKADEILRAELNQVKTIDEYWSIYIRAIKDSPVCEEAYWKWYKLDRIERKERGES